MSSFLTHALIAATYVMSSAALGVVASQIFGFSGWGVAGAALFASVQAHSAVARAMARSEIDSEFADLRRANIILGEELQDARARMAELETALQAESASRRHERGAELRMLQGLLGRVTSAVSAARSRRDDGAAPQSCDEPIDDAATLDVVREA
ncbi:MAG: hypothetical protein AAGL49_05015, partial [Pseudomonadota bacterium]